MPAFESAHKKINSNVNAAIVKMREIASNLIKSTPGMRDEPSRILQGAKDKKHHQKHDQKDDRTENHEQRYYEAVRELQNLKSEVDERLKVLENNQHTYIKRESEYRDVIAKLDKKINDNSSNILENVEDKTDEQYRMKGVDLNDPE